MNIGLVDVDSHNFPNLALMKLSAWHKGQGDTTGLADMFGSYDLTDDYDDSLSRLNFLRSMYRVQPFAQPFRDFTTSHTPPQWQKDMARWANMKATFRTIKFKDYRSR